MGLSSEWQAYLNNIEAGKTDMIAALSERVSEGATVPSGYPEIASAINSIRDKSKSTLNATKNDVYEPKTENSGYNQVKVEVENPDGSMVTSKVFNENGYYEVEEESWDPVIVDVMKFEEMEMLIDDAVPLDHIFMDNKDILVDSCNHMYGFIFENPSSFILVDGVNRIA